VVKRTGRLIAGFFLLKGKIDGSAKGAGEKETQGAITTTRRASAINTDTTLTRTPA
jgi:hypothetical protein